MIKTKKIAHTDSISFRFLLISFVIDSLNSEDFSMSPPETKGEFSIVFWKSSRRVGRGLLPLLWLDEGVEVCETCDRDSTIEFCLDFVAIPKLPGAGLLVETLID